MAGEFEQKLKTICDNEKTLQANETELEKLRAELADAKSQNELFSEKLQTAENVNVRLKEGNIVVQVHFQGLFFQ